MTISIQPLDSHGNPTDKVFHSEWSTFLEHNDGFTIQEATDMQAVLSMGSGYRLGGGAMGAYLLKRVEEAA